MQYVIGSDSFLYSEDGHRLSRTNAGKIIDKLESNLSRPVSVYLMADHQRGWLKVGIAQNVNHRQSQLEYAHSVGLELLHETTALDRQMAGEIERSIHRFLTALKRGPVLDQEWFTLIEHDIWLIRNILNEMPIKAARPIFDTLMAYVDLLGVYPSEPEYIREEIKIGFGSSVFYHFQKEVK